MSLTKKGSRRILVEGVAYRWLVRPKPTYCQGLTWGAMSFAAELEALGQTTLVVTLDEPRPDNWVGETRFAVTPSVVAHAIKRALERGWKPESKGSPFELTLSGAKASSGSGNATSAA